MVDTTNFWIAWAAYCVAAAIYYLVFCRITQFQERRILKYCLRAVMLAIIATPWYVSDTESIMAPALMIVLMDAITIGGEAAIRAFVPLFLSVILSLAVVLIILLVRRGKSRPADETT